MESLHGNSTKMNKTIKLPHIKNMKEKKTHLKAQIADPENIKLAKKKFVPLDERMADMSKKTHQRIFSFGETSQIQNFTQKS